MSQKYWRTQIKKYNKIYTDPIGKETNDGPNNIILTDEISLSMNTRQIRKNNNVLVIDNTKYNNGSNFLKANILQANCNYVITDPTGDLLRSTGKFLENQGYEIKVFNLIEMEKSERYNPFVYIRHEDDVLKMVDCIIENTDPVDQTVDPYWEKAERELLQALVFYLVKYRPKDEHNFASIIKLLHVSGVNEKKQSIFPFLVAKPNEKSKLDNMFDEIAVSDPDSIALKHYLTFKMDAGKTFPAILYSMAVRLTTFNLQQIENLTNEDTLDLGSMGEGKKALFVIIPAADLTFNFLIAMMYSQLFDTLYAVAETKYDSKRLLTPVRFLLDKFSSIGQISEFTSKLITMRPYDISCTIIVHNLAQLKTQYKNTWEAIAGNCDSHLFFGNMEYSTAEYILSEIGYQQTETKRRKFLHKSSSSKYSQGWQPCRLTPADEIMRMDVNYCILKIRGIPPFYDKKFDYTKHKNFQYTADADKANEYEYRPSGSISRLY